MLFFCKWPDRASLLVDDRDADAAREVAKSVADGEVPTDVIPMRERVFVAEVFLGEEGVMLVEPLDHVEQVLAVLDGAEDEDEHEDEDEGAEEGDECAAEADGEDGATVWVCNLPANHGPPKHEVRDEDGTLIASWEVR